jgi:uncharacterized protein YchJ
MGKASHFTRISLGTPCAPVLTRLAAVQSTSSSRRPIHAPAEKSIFNTSVNGHTSTWHGLQIIDTKLVDDNNAYVSFEAQFTQAGKIRTHKEKSLFERENGKWRFVTGEELKSPTVIYETSRTHQRVRFRPLHQNVHLYCDAVVTLLP